MVAMGVMAEPFVMVAAMRAAVTGAAVTHVGAASPVRVRSSVAAAVTGARRVIIEPSVVECVAVASVAVVEWFVVVPVMRVAAMLFRAADPLATRLANRCRSFNTDPCKKVA